MMARKTSDRSNFGITKGRSASYTKKNKGTPKA